MNPKSFSWEIHTSKFVSVYRRMAYEAASGYEPDSAEALVLRDGGKGFSFTFERDEKNIYFSAVTPPLSVGPGVRSLNWDGLIGAFEDWLDVIKYELEEPDLWAEMPRGQALTAIPPDYSRDEKFSFEERKLVADFLKLKNLLLKTIVFQVHLPLKFDKPSSICSSERKRQLNLIGRIFLQEQFSV